MEGQRTLMLIIKSRRESEGNKCLFVVFTIPAYRVLGEDGGSLVDHNQGNALFQNPPDWLNSSSSVISCLKMQIVGLCRRGPPQTN